MLLYALVFCFSLALGMGFLPMLMPLFLLITPFGLTKNKRGISLVLIGILGFTLAPDQNALPSGKGWALFYPIDARPSSAPFSRSWIVKGRLRGWVEDGDKSLHPTSLPIYLSIKQNSSIPLNRASLIYGTLRSSNPPFLLLKPESTAIPLKGSFSLAEKRAQLKELCKKRLKNTLSNPLAGKLLAGLVTGQLDDPLLATHLERLGLSHLLAISGLHLALLTLFLTTCLRPFCSHTLTSVLLGVALTGYLLFVGPAFATQRAYAMTLFVLIGNVCRRHIHPLNLLGVALTLCLCLDPLSFLSPSLQLSFCAVGALLLGMPLLNTTLPTPLSLLLSIQLGVTPLLFFHFHQIYSASLVYNLLLPPLILPLFFLIVPTLLCPFLFAPLTNALTSLFLKLIERLPSLPQLLYTPSYTELVGIVSVLFVTLIFLTIKIERRASYLVPEIWF